MTKSMNGRPIRVLVIDDSPGNRRTITELLESEEGVAVVGRASDGEEGLKRAVELRPDAITLDLEMPRLDGFAFLRLLMARVPTPVIVISSYAHKSDVFKALELGAFDFIPKPQRPVPVEIDRFRRDLLEKVRAVRLIRSDSWATPQGEVPSRKGDRLLIAAVGASTGGPPAVQRIVESLAPDLRLCLLVCQHMPARFTQAFAERLDRMTGLHVSEAQDGDVPAAGRVFIAAGGRQLLLQKGANGELSLRITAPQPQDRHTPSIDRLFESVAAALGPRSLGVVLTGMGADGAEGARAIARVGGRVWAESDRTAVIFGMPQETIATGAVSRVMELPEVAPSLAAEARKLD